MGDVLDRDAALVLAGVAVTCDGQGDLLWMLEAAGIVTARPASRLSRSPRCPRAPRMHQLTVLRSATARSRAARSLNGACLLPGCPRAAPAPGVPCDDCWAALSGFTRPAGAARSAA